MAGNLCRCGAYPKIERAILRAARWRMTARFVRTQKEMEGRYEDVWALVDEADDVESWTPRRRADGRRQARAAPRRHACGRRGRARYTVDVRLAGMLHAAVLRSPVAHGRVRSLDLDAALAVAGRAGRDRARERAVADDARRRSSRPSPATPAQPIAVVAADTLEAARGRRRGALALDFEVLAPRRRPAGRPSTSSASPASRRDDVARRRRGGARRRRRHGRARARDAGPAADAARAARAPSPRGTATSSPPGSRRRACSRAREELARRFGLRKDDVRVIDGVRRRRLRRQAGRRLRGAGRGRARARHRPAGAARQRPPRGAARRRPPRARPGRPCRLGATRDGTLDGDRGRGGRRDGAGRLGDPRRSIPARTLYRCADVRALTFPAQTNLRAAERVPRAGRDGGHDGARAGDGRARARARHRPARAAPPQPRRRRPGQRAAVLEQAAARLLRPRRRARRLGRAATRCASRSADGLLRGMGCATQIWWGGGGPPSHATVRLDAEGHALRRDGHPGHRHGHAHAARRSSPRRSSGSRSIASASSAATPARTSTARSRAARRRRRP